MAINQGIDERMTPALRCSQCGGTEFDRTPIVLQRGLSPVFRNRINYGVKGHACLSCSHVELFLYSGNDLRKTYGFYIAYIVITFSALAAFLYFS